MNLADIRRLRLRELIDAQYEGSQAEFLRASGENQSEISGILGGRKSFGEKKARKIEVALHLPEGWLDEARDEKQAHGAGYVSPQAGAIIAALDSVSENDLVTAIEVLEKVLRAKRASAAIKHTEEGFGDEVESFSVGRPRSIATKKKAC
ncbi:hypothetical protein [Caballeronia temeraria]|nr:hypothetical protein [Caballeronia temeraria]